MVTRSLAAWFGLFGGATRRSLALTLLALLATGAWSVLWAWSASPYARYLGPVGWDDIGAFATLCRSVAESGVVLPALAHALAWVLMVAAMMLPTTFPLLAMFRRITGDRTDAGRLLALVALGYFVAWLGFGVVAHGADSLLLAVATGNGWFVAHGWVVGAAVLAGAGLFQWSALKYRCLDACRTPFGFVSARWHGVSPRVEALRLGLAHGLFCVGCCWALMLVTFVVGMGNLGWMMALAAVMAAEKNLPFGRHLRTPIGLALLGGSAALVLANV